MTKRQRKTGLENTRTILLNAKLREKPVYIYIYTYTLHNTHCVFLEHYISIHKVAKRKAL